MPYVNLEHKAEPKRCLWCGIALVKGQSLYCSDQHREMDTKPERIKELAEALLRRGARLPEYIRRTYLN